MKTLFLILVFALLPLVFLSAQDKKVDNGKTHQAYTIAWKEVTCSECQGWGWRLGEGFKNSTPVSVSGSPINQPVRQRGVANTSVDRYKCMDCNGSGKVQIKYYKSTL